jgi:hypothetical protein
MISEVDLPINDTKNGQVRIFKKSKFSQIVNFRAKIGPLNEIQFSESARQGLSEYVKKVKAGKNTLLCFSKSKILLREKN